MVIKKTFPKGADGQRHTQYNVHYDGEPMALCSFYRLDSAVLLARFLAGGNLADELTERAIELVEGLEGGEQE